MKLFVEPLSGRPMMIPAAPPSGGASVNGKQDVFTATQNQVTYVASNGIMPGTELVMINGLQQPKTEYTVVGDTVEFISGVGIIAGDSVTITYLYT